MIYRCKEFNLFNRDIKATFIISRYIEDNKIHLMLRMEDKRYDICSFHSLGVLNKKFGLSKSNEYIVDKKFWYTPTIEVVNKKDEDVADKLLSLAYNELNIPMNVLDCILDYARLLEKSLSDDDSGNIMSIFDKMYWHVEEF